MKTFLFLLATFLVTSYLFAQDENSTERVNGIRAGYQWATLVSNDTVAADNLNSFYIGYVRQIKLEHSLHLETGLEYMMAGGKVTENIKRNFHYLVVPAQLVLVVGPFNGVAGLNADFKITEKLTINGSDVDIQDEDKSAILDLAADLGAGFNFWLLTAEARYYWGLINVTGIWRNRYYQVGLKYNF